jgi:hypothetical protein
LPLTIVDNSHNIVMIHNAHYHILSPPTQNSLSMQQLIDCDFADFGCNGGLMNQAFQYDQDTNVGLCSLQDYPFAYH